MRRRASIDVWSCRLRVLAARRSFYGDHYHRIPSKLLTIIFDRSPGADTWKTPPSATSCTPSLRCSRLPPLSHRLGVSQHTAVMNHFPQAWGRVSAPFTQLLCSHQHVADYTSLSPETMYTANMTTPTSHSTPTAAPSRIPKPPLSPAPQY